MNDHGDTDVPFLGFTFNNQLLCYDPTSQMWTNPQCFGTVPLPKGGRSSAIIKENVWLFGRSSDDFFHLNMRSFTWTQIQTSQPSPQVSSRCSLTAVTDTQLVLHGGAYEQTFTDRPTWILDLTSYSWRLYISQKDQLRSNHTASLGLNRNIIIGGNNTRTGGVCDKIFHVMLEPKSLQKLSLYTVYKNQADLPWKGLPKKLLSVLGLFDKAQSYGDLSFGLCS